MSDKVQLRFGKNAADTTVEHFLSYHIDADLYTAADAFHMELSDPETKIKAGMRCELWINDQRELTGIVDEVHRRISKRGSSLSIQGRDLMGLLIDSYCEKLMSVSGKTLKELAELLLATVPFINRKDIVYQENVVGKLKKQKKSKGGGFLFGLDAPQKVSQIEPGMTIFEVLRQYSMSRGMLFYSLPDGTFVFGRPMAKGEPSYVLQITNSGVGNNVIEADYVDNISRRYSKVIVKGQRQGQDSDGMVPAKRNPDGIEPDPDFPFYKPYVTRNHNDSLSPQMHAKFIMEKQRRDGRRLTYQVGRHSQQGINWAINRLCHVKDDKNDLDDVYLIYGRTFELNKPNGPTTSVRLGLPGKVA